MGETWSPPEESPLEPNGQPLPISSFGLLPDFSMRLPSNKIIQLRYSFMPGYYDSVKFIIRWLEQIARGESGRVFIDLDDKYQEYISYPKEHDKLRLIANYYPGSSENNQELQLDIRGIHKFRKIIIHKFRKII